MLRAMLLLFAGIAAAASFAEEAVVAKNEPCHLSQGTSKLAARNTGTHTQTEP